MKTINNLLKYVSTIKDNYNFLVFLVETLGPWTAESVSFLEIVGSVSDPMLFTSDPISWASDTHSLWIGN